MTITNRKRDAKSVDQMPSQTGIDVVKTDGLFVLVKNDNNSASWWKLQAKKKG